MSSAELVSQLLEREPFHAEFMRAALEQARLALESWEVPVGCVFVRDGAVVARGSNKPNQTRNATRHAEFEAIDDLLASSNNSAEEAAFSRCDLYVTCEPCIMCAAALSLLRVRHVYFGCCNDKFGGCGTVLSIHRDACGPCGEAGEGFAQAGAAVLCTAGLFQDEAVELLRAFYIRGNPNAPVPHRPLRLEGVGLQMDGLGAASGERVKGAESGTTENGNIVFDR